MRLLEIVLGGVALANLAVAHPTRNSRDGSIKQRENDGTLVKRERMTVTDSNYRTRTVVPEVVVYVDDNGKPVRTATETVVIIPDATGKAHAAKPTAPAPAPEKPTSGSATAEAQAPNSPPDPKPQEETQVLSGVDGLVSDLGEAAKLGDVLPPLFSGSDDSDTSSPQGPTSPSPRRKNGVTYSPYRRDGSCKSSPEVEADWAIFARDHGVVRIYGVDCDQVATAYKAAKKHGNKLFIGIFDIKDIGGAVSSIASGTQGDWDIVDTVSVGNELVNSGQASPAQVVGAAKQARSALRAAGYEGPVVIVDTFNSVLAYPELCDNSDYCAVNAHPFFDPNTSANDAGPFLTRTVSSIRSKMSSPGKRVVVTETGWPWSGQANGRAVPGKSEQSSALASIQGAFADTPEDLIMFTAFNDLWKAADPSTFMTEQFWGMAGRFSPSDQ